MCISRVLITPLIPYFVCIRVYFFHLLCTNIARRILFIGIQNKNESILTCIILRTKPVSGSFFLYFFYIQFIFLLTHLLNIHIQLIYFILLLFFEPHFTLILVTFLMSLRWLILRCSRAGRYWMYLSGIGLEDRWPEQQESILNYLLCV